MRDFIETLKMDRLNMTRSEYDFPEAFITRPVSHRPTFKSTAAHGPSHPKSLNTCLVGVQTTSGRQFYTRRNQLLVRSVLRALFSQGRLRFVQY